MSDGFVPTDMGGSFQVLFSEYINIQSTECKDADLDKVSQAAETTAGAHTARRLGWFTSPHPWAAVLPPFPQAKLGR